jgi:hypothetical protein
MLDLRGGDGGGAEVGYTYFGQFIDHDLTKMNPLKPPTNEGVADDRQLAAAVPLTSLFAVKVANDLRNTQTPKLDLSHLYGGGPSDKKSEGLYENDKVRLRVGPRGTSGRSFDVYVDPVDGKPTLADDRSSENLIIRQIVAVFARLHNAAVAQWKPKIKNPTELFEQARRQTVWQFQYLVIHDYLRRMLTRAVFEEVFENGTPKYEWKKTFSIPVEFAVAAFRFGHSMVRSGYLFSMGNNPSDFDFGLDKILERALQPGQLEDKWEITWGLFFQGAGGQDSAVTSQPIDTLIVKPLHELSNPSILNSLIRLFPITQLPLPITAITPGHFKLPVRTLLRGESMQLASGQTAANAFSVVPLTADELTSRRSDTPPETPPHKPILERDQILSHTPLWYYILKESEIRFNGSRLGPVGSHIVAETISGALRYDRNSYFFNPELPGSQEWRTRNRLLLSSPPVWQIGDANFQIFSLTELFGFAPKLPAD